MVAYIILGALILVGLEFLVRYMKKEREFKNKLNAHWKEPVGSDGCKHNFNMVCGKRVSCSKCGQEKK